MEEMSLIAKMAKRMKEKVDRAIKPPFEGRLNFMELNRKRVGGRVRPLTCQGREYQNRAVEV